jgi:mannose-1-phosphate guanylyltransferase
VAPDAIVEDGATLEGPCFIGNGAIVKSGARVGPYSVIGEQTHVEGDASIEGSILWPHCRVNRGASVRDSILGRHCHIGQGATVDTGAVLGDRTTLTDFTRA